MYTVNDLDICVCVLWAAVMSSHVMSVRADGSLTLYVAPFPRCNPTCRSWPPTPPNSRTSPHPPRTAKTGASKPTTPSAGGRNWVERENVACCISKLTHQGAKPRNDLEVWGRAVAFFQCKNKGSKWLRHPKIILFWNCLSPFLLTHFMY